MSGPNATGRREKSDHTTLEEAQSAYAKHPSRILLDALIYVDGAPKWFGTVDEHGRVSWQPWRV